MPGPPAGGFGLHATSVNASNTTVVLRKIMGLYMGVSIESNLMLNFFEELFYLLC